MPRANVAGRVRFLEASAGSLGLTGPVDFVLAFWMVHEVGDRAGFFEQLRAVTEAGAPRARREPVFHVAREAVEEELALARVHGFDGVMRDWTIRFSWAFDLERM